MKITALIPESLIAEVKKYTDGKNTTECLVKALTEFVQYKKIIDLNKAVSEKPLEFSDDLTAAKIRNRSRRR